MHVFVERRFDVGYVRPVGRFLGGGETRELEYKLGALLDEGARLIVIDLERTQHLNSIAIGILAGTYQRAAERGVPVRLCNADRSIRNVLVILKLVNVLPVFDSLEAAMLHGGTESRATA